VLQVGSQQGQGKTQEEEKKHRKAPEVQAHHFVHCQCAGGEASTRLVYQAHLPEQGFHDQTDFAKTRGN